MKKTVFTLPAFIVSAVLASTISSAAYAQDAKVGSIAVNGAYTRATVPGQAAAGEIAHANTVLAMNAGNVNNVFFMISFE